MIEWWQRPVASREDRRDQSSKVITAAGSPAYVSQANPELAGAMAKAVVDETEEAA